MTFDQRDKESTTCYKSFAEHLSSWVHCLDSLRTCANKLEVQNILDVCALKALEANSRTTTDISIRAESGNHLMLDLTQKARKNARTLKNITILILIYLPVLFVAVVNILFAWLNYGCTFHRWQFWVSQTFLGTGYVRVHVTRKGMLMQFAPEMWIFGILTKTFFLLTIGIWKWREHANMKEDLEVDPRTI